MTDTQTAPAPPIEEALIATCIVDQAAILAGQSRGLMVDDFASPLFGQVWRIMEDLWNAGQPVSAASVFRRLEHDAATSDGLARSVLHDLGGVEGLVVLSAGAHSPDHASGFARDIVTESDRRLAYQELMAAAAEARHAEDPAALVSQRFVDLEARLHRGHGEFVTMGDQAALNATARHAARAEAVARGQVLPGYATGFHDLDRLLGGLQPQLLYFLGARPAMGKTSWCCAIAAHMAFAGIPVVFGEPEQSEGELTDRVIASVGRVPALRMRDGRMDDQEWKRMDEVVEMLAAAPICWLDSPSLSVGDLRYHARQMQARYGMPPVVIADGVQLMASAAASPASRETRTEQIGRVSRSLKVMAKSMVVPVVGAAQARRANDAEGHKAGIGDFAESSHLEQDSDAALFLTPATETVDVTVGYGKGQRTRQEIRVKDNIRLLTVAKNRSGPTGEVELVWLPPYTAFANYSNRDSGF